MDKRAIDWIVETNERPAERRNGDSASALVRMDHISKRFAGTLAVDDLTFDLRPGEVHALLGENGAGKTTSMNILYGLYHADAGAIYVDGQPVRLQSPADANAHEIGMVHQSFRLIPTLSVAENVLLGFPGQGAFIKLLGGLEEDCRTRRALQA